VSVPLESDGRRNKLKEPVRWELKTRWFPWGRNPSQVPAAVEIHHSDVDVTFRRLPGYRHLQERLDFPPQGLVSVTRLLQERVTLGRFAIQGSVVQVGDLVSSPVWLHGRRISIASEEGANSVTLKKAMLPRTALRITRCARADLAADTERRQA
jgi:hypothetical protein